MNLKQVYSYIPAKYVYLMLVMLIIFGLVVFSRQFPAGNDAYYYIIKGSDFLYENALIVFCALLTMFQMPLLAKEMKIKNWKLAGIMLFCAPMFVFRSALFENDIFAIPLCIFSLIMMYRYDNRNKTIHLLLSTLSLSLAFSFWIGALVFLGFFVFHYALKINGYLGILTFCIFIALMPDSNTYVAEQLLGVYAIIPALMMLSIALIEYKRFDQNLIEQLVFFGFPALMVLKFIPFFCIPISIAATYLYDKKKIFLIWCLVGFIVGAGTILTADPTSEYMDSMYDVANITQGEPISNDWYLGHQLNWVGAFPMYTPLNPESDYTLNKYAHWALTNETLDYPIVKQYNKFALYDLHLSSFVLESFKELPMGDIKPRIKRLPLNISYA